MATTRLIWLRRVTASCKDFTEILDSKILGGNWVTEILLRFQTELGSKEFAIYLVGSFVRSLFSHVYSVNPFVTSGTCMSHLQRVFSSPLG
jgi:hypothetical protein